MTVKGKLTDVEKNAIENLVRKGFNNHQIVNILGRSERSRVVKDYVAQIMPTSTEHTEIKVKETKPEEESNLDSQKDVLVKDADFDFSAVVKKLAIAGVHGKKAETLIENALKNLEGELEVEDVYNEAISKLGAQELMIQSSDQGVNNNVVAMTPQAAMKGQEIEQKIKEESGTTTRASRGYVFNTRTGKTE